MTLPTPSQDLVDEWFQWRPDAGGSSQGIHQHQWIANKAAEWGYRQCNATYEQAAMQIVPPTWIEVDGDDQNLSIPALQPMTDQHPITPPPELVRQWVEEAATAPVTEQMTTPRYIATQAARWGANQELEACCEWLNFYAAGAEATDLRAARRPKPPSLKEQALMALEDGDLGPGASLTPVEVCIIRRALEQLDD